MIALFCISQKQSDTGNILKLPHTTTSVNDSYPWWSRCICPSDNIACV